jgi:hypothetical protein
MGRGPAVSRFLQNPLRARGGNERGPLSGSRDVGGQDRSQHQVQCGVLRSNLD